MYLDPEALLALAGLAPMPRTPLAINPCPPGYNLTSVGGKLMCVLEGAESGLDPTAPLAQQKHRAAQAAIMASRGAGGPLPPIPG